MANCNAIKIRPRKNPIPTPANLAHNCAMKKANYWLNDGEEIIQSKSYDDYRKLNEDFKNWEKEAEQRYSNNENKKRKLRSDAVKIEEGMLIIGTDVEISNENIVNMINDFVNKFESENNTKVRHWAYHNHEGHINEQSKEIINRHVHFLFDNVSNTGEMVRKNWKRDYFSKLQDDIYQVSIKYANVERAQKSTYHTVKIGDREVKVNDKKGVHHRVYRKQKEQEQARQKDLKLEIKKLREQLQEEKATRKDYAELEQLNKELKERIQEKDLTIDDLHSKLSDYSTSRREIMLQIAKFEDNNKFKDSLLEKYEYIVESQDETIEMQNKEIKDRTFVDVEELKKLEAEASKLFNEIESNKFNIETLTQYEKKSYVKKKSMFKQKNEFDYNLYLKHSKKREKYLMSLVHQNIGFIKVLMKVLSQIANFYKENLFNKENEIKNPSIKIKQNINSYINNTVLKENHETKNIRKNR